jgi:hypothetical protein
MGARAVGLQPGRLFEQPDTSELNQVGDRFGEQPVVLEEGRALTWTLMVGDSSTTTETQFHQQGISVLRSKLRLAYYAINFEVANIQRSSICAVYNLYSEVKIQV